MENIILLFFLSLAPSSPGLGIILGEPTGLSFSYILSRTNFADGAVAWAFPMNKTGKPRFHLHGDFLFEWDIHSNPEDFEIELPGRFVFYAGPGVSIEIGGTTYLGFRTDLGMRYEFPGSPFDVFLEIAPGIHLLPDTDMLLEGGIGGRFYFSARGK